MTIDWYNNNNNGFNIKYRRLGRQTNEAKSHDDSMLME